MKTNVSSSGSNHIKQILNNQNSKSLLEGLLPDNILTINDSNKYENLSSLTDDEKIKEIAIHVEAILKTLGLDLNDESLKETPKRVAKMYVKETFKGLNKENKPDCTLFSNNYQYNQMLIEKDITLFSTCEHHLVPIYGKAHIAYFSSGKVIGLSKLNRIVDFYARRPQVQERLTVEIANALKEALNTTDVAVIIEANHMCVASRGIKDVNSSTVTADYAGKFLNVSTRNEFLNFIKK